MQVRQVTVRHIPEQDRLLVRMNNAGGEEYRLWLTRRMLAIVWPHLDKVAAQANLEAGDVSQDAAGKKLLSEFRKEAALSQADFATPFNDQPAKLPIGPEPLLATHAHFARQPNGALEVLFEEILPGATQSRGFTVWLELQLQLGMLRLIENAVEAAEWRLQPSQPADTGAGELDDPANRPKYLN